MKFDTFATIGNINTREMRDSKVWEHLKLKQVRSSGGWSQISVRIVVHCKLRQYQCKGGERYVWKTFILHRKDNKEVWSSAMMDIEINEAPILLPHTTWDGCLWFCYTVCKYNRCLKSMNNEVHIIYLRFQLVYKHYKLS